ncbi:MAG TPA: hypothetical protein VHA76_07850 [Solirubrobacterales bacterium]|nr:hypothetical protein [Solirubrobacterales bacterium]
MRRRLLLPSLAAVAVLLAAALPSAARAGPCRPLPDGVAKATLHLPNAVTLRTETSIDGAPSDAYPPEIANVCELGLWSGRRSPGRPAVYRWAREGRGALVTVRTWVPDTGASAKVGEWEGEGFGRLTAGLGDPGFMLRRLGVVADRVEPLDPGGLAGHPGTRLAAEVTVGPAKGLVADAGCWWDPSVYKVACVLVVEAETRPGVTDLAALSGRVVSSLLG